MGPDATVVDADDELGATLDEELAGEVGGELDARLKMGVASGMEAELGIAPAALAVDLVRNHFVKFDSAGPIATAFLELDEELGARLGEEVDTELDARPDMELDAELLAALAIELVIALVAASEKGLGARPDEELDAGLAPGLTIFLEGKPLRSLTGSLLICLLDELDEVRGMVLCCSTSNSGATLGCSLYASIASTVRFVNRSSPLSAVPETFPDTSSVSGREKKKSPLKS